MFFGIRTSIGFGTVVEYFAIDDDWKDLSQFYSTRIKEGFLESMPATAFQIVWLFHNINKYLSTKKHFYYQEVSKHLFKQPSTKIGRGRSSLAKIL